MNNKYVMVFAAGVFAGATFKSLLIFSIILFLIGFAGYMYVKNKTGSLLPSFFKKG